MLDILSFEFSKTPLLRFLVRFRKVATSLVLRPNSHVERRRPVYPPRPRA